jgi:hypothetical protein
MVEMLGVYALLLVVWGLWHARREVVEPVTPPEVEPVVLVAPVRERGDAARRHLGTLS